MRPISTPSTTIPTTIVSDNVAKDIFGTSIAIGDRCAISLLNYRSAVLRIAIVENIECRYNKVRVDIRNIGSGRLITRDPSEIAIQKT